MSFVMMEVTHTGMRTAWDQQVTPSIKYLRHYPQRTIPDPDVRPCDFTYLTDRRKLLEDGSDSALSGYLGDPFRDLDMQMSER